MKTMKPFILPVLFILLFYSCSNPPTGPEAIKQKDEATTWLRKSVEEYFSDPDALHPDMTKICTKEYAEFKSDATSVDMDGGLTLEEFKKKWPKRNSEFAGINEGFLVAGTDHGKIRIGNLKFLRRTDTDAMIFEIVLEDEDFNSSFSREITVIPHQDSFLIDDVKERENIFRT